MDLGQGSGTRRRTASEKSRRGSNKGVGPTSAPCGACKFLRRKCVSGCVFAPYFGSDQGSARFAAVHKVFGASNVSKLLARIPANKRHDAAVTVSYEAQARLSDPIYGCVSTIIALQQEVASLQAELSVVQTQLMNSRLESAIALNNQNSITGYQLQEQALQHIAMLHLPAYSNGTCSASYSITNYNHTAPSNNILDGINYGHALTSSPLKDDNEDKEGIPFANNSTFC